MHVHRLRRNVTSNTHVRSSLGSSKEIHSCRSVPGMEGHIRFAAVDDALIGDLGAALSPDRVRVSDVELGLYDHDASGLSGTCPVVCFPLTTAEVQAANASTRADSNVAWRMQGSAS